MSDTRIGPGLDVHDLHKLGVTFEDFASDGDHLNSAWRLVGSALAGRVVTEPGEAVREIVDVNDNPRRNTSGLTRVAYSQARIYLEREITRLEKELGIYELQTRHYNAMTPEERATIPQAEVDAMHERARADWEANPRF